jgi:hypothetical protein
VWSVTSLELNSTLDPRVVAEAFEEDAARATAKHNAEFRDDVAAFVSREAVDQCVVPNRIELPRISGMS